MPQDKYITPSPDSNAFAMESSVQSLNMLTRSIWEMSHSGEDCPDDKYPTFKNLDNLLSTTAWGSEARQQFFSRWKTVESSTQKRFEVGSFTELTHLVWEVAVSEDPRTEHPLAPLIEAWQSGPKEVLPVRDSNGKLRPDTIVPRIAMRQQYNQRTDRLYLTPAHTSANIKGNQSPLPGFEERGTGSASRVPMLPVNLYDLGVEAGESTGGGRGAAPISARMLVRLAAAPSAFVRHGERFVTYQITLRDLRSALYPPYRLNGARRKPPPISRMWPRVLKAIRVINQDARIPVLNPQTGYGHYHHLLRINENFGRIDLDMPIGIVLDIPPEVEGGVQLPVRLDQWGCESAPAYRALIGLSFLWHEPGRTHAPTRNGTWIRRTGLDPYDPITDDDAIALAYPSSTKANRRELIRRAWKALEHLEEYGELTIEGRRILPPKDSPKDLSH